MSLLPQDTRDSLVARLDNPDDVAAWDEVMAVYGPLVYRVALKQGLQKADAEDVVQEVFLTVLKSVSDWLASAATRHSMYSIASRRAAWVSAAQMRLMLCIM